MVWIRVVRRSFICLAFILSLASFFLFFFLPFLFLPFCLSLSLSVSFSLFCFCCEFSTQESINCHPFEACREAISFDFSCPPAHRLCSSHPCSTCSSPGPRLAGRAAWLLNCCHFLLRRRLHWAVTAVNRSEHVRGLWTSFQPFPAAPEHFSAVAIKRS